MSQEKFPVIPIPMKKRALEMPFDRVWGDVVSAEDLPTRFFSGDLVKESFETTAEGWKVRYEGGAFSLTAERKGAGIFYTEFFQGKEISMSRFPATARGWEFGKICPRPPGTFDSVLKPYYEKRYNLGYLPMETEKPRFRIMGFPDGYFQWLMVPISFSEGKLNGLLDAMDELGRGGTASFNGGLVFVPMVVNYLEGRCTEVPTGEGEHLLWLLNNGWICTTPPVWQGKAGDRALTSQRHGYVLVLNFAMRHGPEIVRCLNAHGLIEDEATCTNSEELAFMLYAQDAEFTEDVARFTKDMSRRVVLPFANGENRFYANDVRTEPTTMAELAASLTGAVVSFNDYFRKVYNVPE